MKKNADLSENVTNYIASVRNKIASHISQISTSQYKAKKKVATAECTQHLNSVIKPDRGVSL